MYFYHLPTYPVFREGLHTCRG